ncbi:DUF924 family protein [Sphingomonas sp. MMS12-HWE2-04]|uniref:DUF924 family protein n=1 Tax=Sphingomonas sp. MMS12-HWE2-04 TaxID=3234199 RepID=UPI00384C3D65
MASDLGAQDAEVHAKAREVLGFWFEGLMPEQYFARSDAVDAAIRERFAALREEVLHSGARGWDGEPDTLLAAVVVLDQFSRNLFRDQAEAYAADPLARTLTCRAIEQGWDKAMPVEHRHFLYMPLMHAEDREMQTISLECFTALGDEQTLDFARAHAEVIARFGRFPTRNAALGRESTPEERAYLAQPGVGW